MIYISLINPVYKDRVALLTLTTPTFKECDRYSRPALFLSAVIVPKLHVGTAFEFKAGLDLFSLCPSLLFLVTRQLLRIPEANPGEG